MSYDGQFGGYGYGASAARPRSLAAERAGFLKKVYGLFTASIGVSAIGAVVALTAGAASSQAKMAGVVVPPAVAFFAQHWWVGVLLMLGSVFGASALRHKPVVNVVALFAMAGIIGVVIAPALFFAQVAAGLGATVSANPVRDAFILSVVAFGGLTGYALVSGKDFSFMRGALTMGLFVIIGAVLLNLFLQSSVLGLAIASVTVLLFGAFVLYDTSKLLRSSEEDAVGGAIGLYLDFLNIFLALLRILGAARR